MPSKIANSSSKTQQNSGSKVNRKRVSTKLGVRGVTKTNKSQGASMNTTPKPRRSAQKRSPNLLISLILFTLRVGIMGVGVGVIAGTTLAFFKPTNFLAAYFKSDQVSPTPEAKSAPLQAQANPPKNSHIATNKELTALKTKLQKIDDKYPNINPQAWFIDLDNGAYVSLKGTAPIPAASTIKIPVLVAFFEEVDAGKIHLDQMLTMDKEVIVSGSGNMQYMPVGKKFTALEVATKMIVISDNTATEMLIRELGGKEVLNKKFKKWGMNHTVINNLLPDLEGTNKTSSEDLSKLLARVERGDLISPRSRDRLLAIMEKTRTRTLLPQGLEKQANIAHKTGDIGTVIGDAGIIDMPTGKRYIGAVFAERAYDNPAGRALIQEFSRTVYQHFKYYQPRPLPKSIEKKPQTQSQSNNSNTSNN